MSLRQHRPRLRGPLMAVASAVQTVPSLAMFGFLLPVPLLRRPHVLRGTTGAEPSLK